MKVIFTILFIGHALLLSAQQEMNGREKMMRENYKPVTPADLITKTEITIVPKCYTWPDPMANYTPIKYVFTRARLSVMSYTNINDIIATLPGSYQRRRGDEVIVHGSGAGDIYIDDGALH